MFRNLTKERELIDKELDLYKREKLIKIDEECRAYNDQMLELAKKCLDDEAAREHTYHSTMEQLGINIAKLEAKKESLELAVNARLEVIKADQNMYNNMNAEIIRLNEIINNLIKHLPTTIVQQVKSN